MILIKFIEGMYAFYFNMLFRLLGLFNLEMLLVNSAIAKLHVIFGLYEYWELDPFVYHPLIELRYIIGVKLLKGD